MQQYFLLLIGLVSLSLSFTACQKDIKEVLPPNTLLDERDGEWYKTKVFGDQVWMIENLRYKASGSFQNPNNLATNYGRLYTWDIVMNGMLPSVNSTLPIQGLCPKGWHIPNDEEWKRLEQKIGLGEEELDKWGHRGTIASSLKSTTGWANNSNGSNLNRFYVFPAGVYKAGGYGGLGTTTYFFTSTVSNLYTNGVSYLTRSMYHINDAIGRGELFPTDDWAISCRCVQD